MHQHTPLDTIVHHRVKGRIHCDLENDMQKILLEIHVWSLPFHVDLCRRHRYHRADRNQQQDDSVSELKGLDLLVNRLLREEYRDASPVRQRERLGENAWESSLDEAQKLAETLSPDVRQLYLDRPLALKVHHRQ